MSVNDTNSLKEKLIKNLKENILDYWIKNTVDEAHGGFVGLIDFNNKINFNSDKRSILNTRILWSFSSTYLLLNDEKYLIHADRAYQYLFKKFKDTKFGGIYWDLDYQGNPTNRRKQIYAQAFAIYALTEYYKCNQKSEVLNWAKELFFHIEEYSLDKNKNGYFEAFTEDWEVLEDVRLSEKDMNEKKTMNTHLHILEAYTNLYRIWPSEQLSTSLSNLIEIFLKFFINKDNHLNLFFDEHWNLKSNIISFGHDIECSWLLYEAADVLHDNHLIDVTKQKAIQMAEAAFSEGVDKDGSILNELNLEKYHLDTDRHWWPQAEGLVGFYNAYQLSGDNKFLDATFNLWNFIDYFVVDHKGGEWFGIVDNKGNPYPEDKVGPWKCPYHNARACIELITRIRN